MRVGGPENINSKREEPIKISPKDQAVIDQALRGTQKIDTEKNKTAEIGKLEMENPELNKKEDDLDNLQMENPELNRKPNDLDNLEMEDPRLNRKPDDLEHLEMENPKLNRWQPEVEPTVAGGGAGQSVENAGAATPEENIPETSQSEIAQNVEQPVNPDDPLDLENLQMSSDETDFARRVNNGRMERTTNPVEQPAANQDQAVPEQEANSAEQPGDNVAAQNNLDANQELTAEQARAVLDQKFDSLKVALEAEAKTQKDYGYFARMAKKLGLVSKNSQAHEEYGKMVENRKAARTEYDAAMQQYMKVLVKQQEQLIIAKGYKNDSREMRRQLMLMGDVIEDKMTIEGQEQSLKMSPIEFINYKERELIYAREKTLGEIDKGILGKMRSAVWSGAKELVANLKDKYKIKFKKGIPRINRKTDADRAKADAKQQEKNRKLEKKMARKVAKGESVERLAKKYNKKVSKQTTAYETTVERDAQVEEEHQLEGKHILYFALMNRLNYNADEVAPIVESYEKEIIQTLQKEFKLPEENAQDYFNWRMNNVNKLGKKDIFRLYRTGSRQKLEISGFINHFNSLEYKRTAEYKRYVDQVVNQRYRQAA